MVILMAAKNAKDITNEKFSRKIWAVILTIRKETLFLENN